MTNPEDKRPAPVADGLEYWTCDEVAECLPVSKDLYRRLWAILGEAERRTPTGGDGTGGTCEYPDARYGTGEDDKARQWWGRLTPEEQMEINSAYRAQEEDS
jgi:hypothetical protein